jgi:hypothetical protein
MSAFALHAQKEKELYAPTTRLLEAHGYHVWEEATIRAGDSGTRTADHVAWRWDDDRVETIAVEVKPGPADVGLAQAVAYCVGFNRVYVGAEEDLHETGYLGKVFKRLSLGYIRVSPQQAVLQREAGDPLLLSQPVYDENVARIRLKAVFLDDVLGEPVRFGRDRRGDIWAVAGTSEWQLCGQVVTGSDATWLSLLAETKWVATGSLKMGVEGFAAAMGAIAPLEPELLLRRREHKGYQPKYSDVLASWRCGDPQPALHQLLSDAAELEVPKAGPHFEIRARFWPHGVPLSEAQARVELREAAEHLNRAREILNQGVA